MTPPVPDDSHQVEQEGLVCGMSEGSIQSSTYSEDSSVPGDDDAEYEEKRIKTSTRQQQYEMQGGVELSIFLLLAFSRNVFWLRLDDWRDGELFDSWGYARPFCSVQLAGGFHSAASVNFLCGQQMDTQMERGEQKNGQNIIIRLEIEINSFILRVFVAFIREEEE